MQKIVVYLLIFLTLYPGLLYAQDVAGVHDPGANGPSDGGSTPRLPLKISDEETPEVKQSALQSEKLAELYIHGLKSIRALDDALKAMQEKNLFPSELYQKWSLAFQTSKEALHPLISMMREDLRAYWLQRGIKVQWLSAVSNSFCLLVISLVVQRYQVALWRMQTLHEDTGSITQHYFKAIDKISDGFPEIKKIVGDTRSFMERNGVGSETYQRTSQYLNALNEREAFHLKLVKEIYDRGFHDDRTWLYTPFQFIIDKWDQTLGKWKIANGEEYTHAHYIQLMYASLDSFQGYLDRFVRAVKDRGVVENYFEDGVIPSGIAFLDKIFSVSKNKDTNSEEIRSYWTQVCDAQRRLRALAVPDYIVREVVNKSVRAVKETGELLQKDISQVKWAYGAAVALPLLYPAAKIAIVTGLLFGITSAKLSLGLAMGVPLGMATAKGMAHFLYQGLRDERHLTFSNFFNDLIPELSYAIPATIAGSFIWGATVTLAPAAAMPLFYVSAGVGTTVSLVQGINGYALIRAGKIDDGVILLMDSAINLMVLMKVFIFARYASVPTGGGRGVTPSVPVPGGSLTGGGLTGSGLLPPRPNLTGALTESAAATNTGTAVSATAVAGTATAGQATAGQVTAMARVATAGVKPMTGEEFEWALVNVLPTEPVYTSTTMMTLPGTASACVSQLGTSLLAWTGVLPIEDVEEAVEILIKDDEGRIISRRLLRVKKGSTDAEIWKAMGYRDPRAEIIRGGWRRSEAHVNDIFSIYFIDGINPAGARGFEDQPGDDLRQPGGRRSGGRQQPRGDDRSIALILEAISDPDVNVFKEAVMTLGSLKSTSIAKVLLQKLEAFVGLSGEAVTEALMVRSSHLMHVLIHMREITFLVLQTELKRIDLNPEYKERLLYMKGRIKFRLEKTTADLLDFVKPEFSFQSVDAIVELVYRNELAAVPRMLPLLLHEKLRIIITDAVVTFYIRNPDERKKINDALNQACIDYSHTNIKNYIAVIQDQISKISD